MLVADDGLQEVDLLAFPVETSVEVLQQAKEAWSAQDMQDMNSRGLFGDITYSGVSPSRITRALEDMLAKHGDRGDYVIAGLWPDVIHARSFWRTFHEWGGLDFSYSVGGLEAILALQGREGHVQLSELQLSDYGAIQLRRMVQNTRDVLLPSEGES